MRRWRGILMTLIGSIGVFVLFDARINLSHDLWKALNWLAFIFIFAGGVIGMKDTLTAMKRREQEDRSPPSRQPWQ